MSDNRKIRRRQRCPEYWQTYFISNDLRKAYIHLKRAVPNLFRYIDNPGLPRTTNSLETFFGHVKDQLRLHRGLRKPVSTTS